MPAKSHSATLEEERREIWESVLEELETCPRDAERLAACAYLVRHLVRHLARQRRPTTQPYTLEFDAEARASRAMPKRGILENRTDPCPLTISRAGCES